MGKILCGDAIEMLRTLDAESVDAVVTDPPYVALVHKRLDGNQLQMVGL